jgi:hypothetical protein
MKKFAPPQVIILLDFLFVFLLILIIQKPANIKISLPEKQISDAYVVVKQNGRYSHIFIPQQGGWLPFQAPSSSNYSEGLKGSSLFTTVQCNSVCQRVPRKRGEMEILLTGKLYSKISNTLLSACLHNSQACSSMEFNINEDGEIDKELLLEKNPIFKDIFK